MNKHLLIVILAVLVPIQLPAQQSSQSKETNTGASSSAQHIKGKGCVRPGRQSGCLVVNDIKAHRKYNVFFYGKDLPEMYTAIAFEGIGYAIVGSQATHWPRSHLVGKTRTLFARQHFYPLLVQDDLVDQRISRLKVPRRIPVFREESIQKPCFLFAIVIENARWTKNYNAGIDEGGVACETLPFV
jgi:hypothetical protein